MSRGNFELDVLIIVSSDPRYDTRSTKFLKALTDTGYATRVVGICSDGNPGNGEGTLRLPISARAGKRFFLQFYQRVIPQALKMSAQVVIAGDLFSLPPAIINKQRHSGKTHPVRLIYDSKELYGELPSLKRKRISFMFWNLVEKSSIRYLDAALTVNQSISEILAPKWRVPFTIVMNVPDKTPSPGFPKSFQKILLAFSGGLQPGRGLHNLIKMMTLLPDKYELKIIGDGALRDELSALAASMKLGGRVHFTGRVRSDRVVAELSQAHMGIYLMENSGLCHYLALPNKFFQFISAGLPVIVPDFPEMKRIVNKYEIGAVVDSADLHEAADAVMKFTSEPEFYAKLRANCEKAALELNWEIEKGKFLEAVGKLVQ